MQTSAILLGDDDQLRVEGTTAEVLAAVGEAIRVELYRSRVTDYQAVMMRCLVRAHFRLGDAGLIVRQVGR